MRPYKQGKNRNQTHLFPARLDDYVSTTNTVRAIDAYVSVLDLSEFEFHHTDFFLGSGQPPYDPADLLKLYLYGYTNHIHSSRKLERETQRNIEVMWLLGQLTPSYKTIADFRKNNPKALKQVNRDFILMCKELKLYGGEKIAVDGSYFKANTNKANITTKTQLKQQLQQLDKKIDAYHQALEKNDQQEDKEKSLAIEDPHLPKKLKHLKERQTLKQKQLIKLNKENKKQLSTLDPDARLLSKRGQSVAGYNVQSVVDDKHHLIIHSQVTQDGNDLHQLYSMASAAKELLDVKKIIALADTGYYEGKQLKRCEEEGIIAYVSIPDRTKVFKKQGRFSRDDFTYNKEQNHYICPQGNLLKVSGKPEKKDNKKRIRYSSKAPDCNECPLRQECLPKKGKTRQLYRWKHEDVLERHHQRMKQPHAKQEMVQRASLVEHPFGTLKNRAGGTYHFLVRGLKKVKGEWSLMVFGYNFTRVLNIIGVKDFMNYCAQRKQNAENMSR